MNSKLGGVGIVSCFLLGACFVFLKLTGEVSWSWNLVLWPFYGPLVVMTFIEWLIEWLIARR